MRDYYGHYYIQTQPDLFSCSIGTGLSWDKIEKLADASEDHIMHYTALCLAVENHKNEGKRPQKPHQFINYCIRKGWLVKTQSGLRSAPNE